MTVKNTKIHRSTKIIADKPLMFIKKKWLNRRIRKFRALNISLNKFSLTFCKTFDFFADILETVETLSYFGGAVDGEKAGGGRPWRDFSLFQPYFMSSVRFTT